MTKEENNQIKDAQFRKGASIAFLMQQTLQLRWLN